MSINNLEQEGLQKLDGFIGWYATLSNQDQLKTWQKVEFVKLFPRMVERVLSPDGVMIYPESVRMNIFESSMHALHELSLNPEKSQREIIPIHGLSYNIEHGEIRGHQREIRADGDTIEPLGRIVMAGTIALGMSISSLKDEQITERLLAIKTIHNERSIMGTLSFILPLNSTSREWVRMYELDRLNPDGWDKTVARIISKMHDAKVKGHNTHLPSEFTTPNSYEEYSTDAFDAFLDHAVELSERASLTSMQSTQLMQFTFNIRNLERLHPEFTTQPHVRAGLAIILHNVNRRFKSQDEIEVLEKARAIRRDHRP